jgi:hypothetical protein
VSGRKAPSRCVAVLPAWALCAEEQIDLHKYALPVRRENVLFCRIVFIRQVLPDIGSGRPTAYSVTATS